MDSRRRAFRAVTVTLADLSSIADDLNGRRLVITSSGLDITIGRKRLEFGWEDAAGAALISGHLYISPKPGTKPVRSPFGIPAGVRQARRTGQDGPGEGWVFVCPADGFGAPAGIVGEALAHYAGPVWEPAPGLASTRQPGGPGRARS